MLRGRDKAGRLSASLALVCLAVFLRVLIPPGFMPAFGPDEAGMVICGVQTSASRVDATPANDHSPQQTGDAACAFAGIVGPAILPAPKSASAVATGQAPGPTPSQPDLRPGRGLAAPPPFPTGPPSTVQG
jgi:hypothetical protein